MADTKYFYKRITDNLFNVDGNIIPAGNYNLIFHSSDSIVELRDFTNNNVILSPIEITNLLKENDTAYANKAELLLAVADFF